MSPETFKRKKPDRGHGHIHAEMNEEAGGTAQPGRGLYYIFS